jgi:uncharacterized protein
MHTYSIISADLEELDQFLFSDQVSDESMTLSMLDGYLTAIATGPNSLAPSQWLSGVWGPDESDSPEFESMEQAQRIMGMIFNRMNEIVDLQRAMDGVIEPIFDYQSYPSDEREYTDGEMWAAGFIQGMQLDPASWEPFVPNAAFRAILTPIYLLDGNELSDEEEELVRWPEQREKLSEQIAGNIQLLYHLVLPYRQAVSERMVAKTFERSHPKVGRNDPCPCGSGKKFKKCCGAAADLH